MHRTFQYRCISPNEMYVVLSDYIDAATASVDTPVVDTDAAAEYYNLQGMRVDSAALAVDAGVGVDNVDFAFGYCFYGAFGEAGAASDTFVGDYVSHFWL